MSTLPDRTPLANEPAATRSVSRRAWLSLAATGALAACASPVPTAQDGAEESPGDEPTSAYRASEEELAALNASAWARASSLAVLGEPPGRWFHQTFPSYRHTDFTPLAAHAGRPALRALAHKSNSLIRHQLNWPSVRLGGLRLGFSWLGTALNPGADVGERGHDDAIARVVLTFDGDRSGFTARDHLVSELAHLLTGTPLPNATLMYVWDTRHPVGTVVDSPASRRIRYLVVDSGSDKLGRWADHERDIARDFRTVFGESPGELLDVGLMCDSNNTGAAVESYFGPVRLSVSAS